MLAPISEPIEVRPAGAEVVYRLRRPTAPDRARYERELRLAGGRDWTLVDLYRALDDAVDELIPADDPAGREALHRLIGERIEAIESVLARVRAGLPTWGEEFQALWAQATTAPRVVLEFGEEAQRRPTRYAELLADLAALPTAQGVAAARVLLLEVRHDDGRVERGGPAVADRIPTHHLQAIGRAVQDALYLSEAARKNSPSASGSSSEAPSSTSSSGPPSSGPVGATR